MNSQTWRDVSRERIELALIEYEAACLCSGETMELKAFNKCLTRAYPFYERENHPYKIWLSECKFARKFMAAVAKGEAQARHYVHASEAAMHQRKSGQQRKPVEGQIGLF